MTLNSEQPRPTEAKDDLRPLTEPEATHVELVMLRFVRKTLADGDAQLAGDMAVQFDKLLAAALSAATLYVNGHPGCQMPLSLH